MTRVKGPVGPEFDPPFDVLEPPALTSPVVLSSPHSGRIYPPRFLRSARLDAASLRRSEDAFVDDLFAPAVAVGLPLLRAHFPRAYLDLNREPYELDPRMFEGRLPAYVNTRSVRVAGGLGTIARVVGDSQEIYAKRMSVEEGLRRIDELHKPYHAALQGLLHRALRRFGLSVLVDCHSMPSSSVTGTSDPTTWRDEKTKADFVLGDRYGTSCGRRFVDVAEGELRRFGYAVERNKPYAGGFITEHYGRPAAGCHALQIEINRGLYMDERALARGPGFEAVSRHLFAVVSAISDLARADGGSEQIAAE